MMLAIPLPGVHHLMNQYTCDLAVQELGFDIFDVVGVEMDLLVLEVDIFPSGVRYAREFT